MENQAPGLMKEAERFLILSNIDRLWKEHLQALKLVQQAVGLRGYAQRDPLIEYKLEGYNLFLEMMAQIRRNVIYSIYQVYIKPELDIVSSVCAHMSHSTHQFSIFISPAMPFSYGSFNQY